MKIPNPFRNHPHTRCETYLDNGEKVVSVHPAGDWLEVPDGALEARIDAVDKGRSDAKVLSTRMWGREMGGIMDVADFAAKLKLREEQEKFEAEKKEALAKKKAKAAEQKLVDTVAQERAKRAKPAKAVEEKPVQVISEK